MTHLQEIQDINGEKSNKSGVSGHLESFLRKFRHLVYLLILIPVATAYILCLGISLTPGILIFEKIQEATASSSLLVHGLALGCAMAAGFICFIFTIICVVPIFNAPALPFVKTYRGPWFSLESIPWFYHNALTYLVRYTILDFITPTPLNIFFFRMMGMKIGKACMINTSNVSDPCLIQLGDYVTVGGSAYIMAHYGMKGYLIVDRLSIGAGSNIGLNAKILGGVQIGRRVTVGPNATVFPKTILKDMEKYGVPEKVNTAD